MLRLETVQCPFLAELGLMKIEQYWLVGIQ
jgi:hypothetical protein